jgi:hypothetical protein
MCFSHLPLTQASWFLYFIKDVKPAWSGYAGGEWKDGVCDGASSSGMMILPL